ncbi:hypothetical protein [Mycolicibacterium thermoresistibile]
MTRRRWWIVGAIGVVTAIAVVATGLVIANRHASECAIVRSIIDYNNQFNQEVSDKTDARVETTESDYRQWATHLRDLADQISGDERNLDEHAANLADLAGQFAELYPRFRAESLSRPPLEADPPESLREYSRIGQEFDTKLVALDNACPA